MLKTTYRFYLNVTLQYCTVCRAQPIKFFQREYGRAWFARWHLDFCQSAELEV